MSEFHFKRSWLLIPVVIFTLSSCVSNEQVTYLQEHELSSYSDEYFPPETYIIQPNDNLYVRIATPDPSLSAIFNVMDERGMMRADEASAHLISYPVDLEGMIDMPYLGRIEVAGKTLAEAKIEIETVLAEYVDDASLTIKLVNNYVSVLGEVTIPGLYPIYKERLNIFQALAMAGDVDDYGDRFGVSVIRQTPEGSVVKEFDITDKKIIDSEFYYVMPNDIIYVKPLKGRYFAINTAPYLFAFSTIAALGTLVLLIQNTRLLSAE
jgi:polysaccharide export outer membrane protein